MLNEKKLVTLFKDFFDKTCLSYIREHSSVFKQWLYFSTMLSQEFIDYSKVQKYVKELSFDRKQVLTEKTTNIHSLSVSYAKGGASAGSFYKPDNDSFKSYTKSPISSSLDYGKHFSMNTFKSDTQIMKQLEGREKEKEKEKEQEKLRQKEKQRQKQWQRQKQIERQRQRQREREKQRQKSRQKQRQKNQKKPLSKFVSNLSGLYESFSDNQRKLEKRLNPPIVSQQYSAKFL